MVTLLDVFLGFCLAANELALGPRGSVSGLEMVCFPPRKRLSLARWSVADACQNPPFVTAVAGVRATRFESMRGEWPVPTRWCEFFLLVNPFHTGPALPLI